MPCPVGQAAWSFCSLPGAPEQALSSRQRRGISSDSRSLTAGCLACMKFHSASEGFASPVFCCACVHRKISTCLAPPEACPRKNLTHTRRGACPGDREYKELPHEKNLPAQQDPSRPHPRLPRPHGHQERPCRHHSSPCQGPQEPERLTCLLRFMPPRTQAPGKGMPGARCRRKALYARTPSTRSAMQRDGACTQGISFFLS